MSKLQEWFRNRYVVVGSAVVVLAIVVLLSNRPATTPEGFPVIVDAESFNKALELANDMVKPPFDKDRNSEPLTETDLQTLRKAAKLIDSLGRYHPTNVITFVYAGKVYRMLSEQSVAEARFQQAIANENFDKSEGGVASVNEAKYELSQIKLLENKLDEALAFADAAARARSDSAVYITARASVELQMGKIDAATHDLDAADMIDPTYQRARQLRRLLQLSKSTETNKSNQSRK